MFKWLMHNWRRVYIFYVLLITLFVIAWQFYFSRMHTIGESLSRFTPDINYFELKNVQTLTIKQKYLKECRIYHELVSIYYRFQEPEAQMVVGFCSYLDNQIQSAINAYQHTKNLNPSYFWPYYNLGVIYFRQQEWQKAIDYFKEALNQDLVHNEMMYRHSKVLTDIRLSDKKGDLKIDDFLKMRYAQAIEYTLYGFYKTENYRDLLNVALQALENKVADPIMLQRYAAMACVHLNLWDKAAIFLEKVLNHDPQDADALLYLSRIYQYQKNYLLAEELRVLSEQYRQKHGSLMEKSINPEVVIF